VTVPSVDGDPRVDRGDERVVEHDVAARAAADRALHLPSGRHDAVAGP